MSSCKALPQNLYDNKKSTIIKEDNTKYANNNIEYFNKVPSMENPEVSVVHSMQTTTISGIPSMKTTVMWIFSLCAALFLSYYCNDKYSNFTPPTVIIHMLVAICCPQCYICYILIYSIFNNKPYIYLLIFIKIILKFSFTRTVQR